MQNYFCFCQYEKNDFFPALNPGLLLMEILSYSVHCLFNIYVVTAQHFVKYAIPPCFPEIHEKTDAVVSVL